MANIAAQRTGLSALPQLTTLPINIETALGNLQQQTQQNALTAAYNEWLRQQAYSNPYLNLLPVALGNSYNPLPIIASPPTQTPGLLSSIMPGIGYAAGRQLPGFMGSLGTNLLGDSAAGLGSLTGSSFLSDLGDILLSGFSLM